MSTRSRIGFQYPDGTIISSYCHFDGYLDGVGYTLVTYYNNEAEAEEIASIGDMSILEADTLDSAGFNDNIYEDSEPLRSKDFEAYAKACSNCYADYMYLFKDNKWYYEIGTYSFSEDELKPVPMSESMKLTEAPDEDGFETDDEIEAAERAEFEKRLAQRKADRDNAIKAKKEEEEKARLAATAKERGQEVLDEIDNADGDDFVERAFSVLVPSQGKADTVAGEIIRAINRIMYRDFNDGDLFYSGYGKETAGPAAAYLYENTNQEIADSLMELCEDAYAGNDYSNGLADIADLIEEYLREEPELCVTDNETDIFDYGDDYWDDYEPSYEIYIDLPDEIQTYLEKDKISTSDVEDEVSYWEWNGKRGDEYFHCSSTSLNIDGLTLEGYDEWENYGEQWLNQWVDDLESEYGPADFDPTEITADELAEHLDGNNRLQAAEEILRYIDDGQMWDDFDFSEDRDMDDVANTIYREFSAAFDDDDLSYYKDEFAALSWTISDVQLVLDALGVEKDDEEWEELEKALQESLKESKQLNENTSNFTHHDYLPLLCWYSESDLLANSREDSESPKPEDFEDEDDYWDAIDAFEERYFDKYSQRMTILDDYEMDNLTDDLDAFNAESKDIAYDLDVDENGYQKYGNNLDLEDIELYIKPGYFEGYEIACKNEEYFDNLDSEVKTAQLARFNKFLEELKKKYYLTKLGVSAKFSNGETWYSKIESLKENKLNEHLKWGFNVQYKDGTKGFEIIAGVDTYEEAEQVVLSIDEVDKILDNEVDDVIKQNN